MQPALLNTHRTDLGLDAAQSLSANQGGWRQQETLCIEFASKAAVVAQNGKCQKGAMATITGHEQQREFPQPVSQFFSVLCGAGFALPHLLENKIISMVAGTVSYDCMVFKLYLIQLMFFNQPDIAIYQTGPTALNLVKGIRFCMTLGTNVLVVLLIWRLWR